MIYVKQSSNEKRIRVKPLTGKKAESVWNDEDERWRWKMKDLEDKILNDDETLIEQVLKEPPSPQKKKKIG